MVTGMLHRLRSLMLAVSLVVPIVGAGLTDDVGAAGEVASIDCSATAPSAGFTAKPAPSFTALAPQRLVDTRDGTGGPTTPLGAGCTMRISFAASTSVPSTASAVALSVVAIDAAARGFLTVYPCSVGRPGTSNLNTRPGVPTPNLVTATLDANREVCVFASVPTNVLVDLTGWWGPGTHRFYDLDPVRTLDTRGAPRPGAGTGPILANTVFTVPMAGPWVPADTTSVVLNLTVVGAVGAGWLLAFPCGTTPPLASNLNFLAAEERAGSAIVGIGTGGAVCLLTNVDVHVIVDLNGMYGPAPDFGSTGVVQPLSGTRVLDSRFGTGGWTTQLAAGEIRAFDPVVATPYATSASAVALNVIATESRGRGHLRVFPCGSALPTVSSVNFTGVGEATNLVTMALGGDRRICIFALTATHVVVDLFGVVLHDGLVKDLVIDGATIQPAFTSDGTDYVIRCGSGTTPINLGARALPNTSVALDGVPLARYATPALQTDQAMTLRFTRGFDTVTYSFRCLPVDFPTLIVDRPGEPSPGWYLTTLGWNVTGSGTFAVILDNRGVPVWYKRTTRPVIDLKRLNNGQLAWTPLLGSAYGVDPANGYRVVNLSGALVTQHRTVGAPTDHHDYIELPAGARAQIAYVRRDNVNVTSLTGLLGQTFFADETVVDNVIQEIDAGGSLTWSWSTDDHFAIAATRFPQRFQQMPGAPHGGEVDLAHINSINRQPDGDYIVSARHYDGVFRIDRATGEVQWTLGMAASANLDGAPALTIVGDPLGGPKRMHDAILSEDGILTMFDNRTGTGQASRMVVYRINTVANTATMIRQFSDPLGARTSFGLGSARIAADGSALITWGGLLPSFEEIDAAGARLLAVSQPAGALSYRTIKYPLSAFSIDQLRANAGGTAQLS
jgi:hypothetical protein